MLLSLAKKLPKTVQKRPFMSHKFSEFFLPKSLKKWKPNKCFYVVAFDPIRIRTRLTPQNEHQHLSFVKNIHGVGKK